MNRCQIPSQKTQPKPCPFTQTACNKISDQAAVGAQLPFYHAPTNRNAIQRKPRILLGLVIQSYHYPLYSIFKEHDFQIDRNGLTRNRKLETRKEKRHSSSSLQFLVSSLPEWSRPGSNRQPLACKASALPIELRPRSCRPHRATVARGSYYSL